jgi:hypothetical protein
VADNQEVCIGGSALLTATLSGGSSAVSIQWQSSLTGGDPFTDIAGETNLTYDAPTNAAGVIYYRVQVLDPNSDCATPNSNVVVVIVNEDAVISAEVDNAEVCIDGSAVLTATLTGGSGSATLQWEESTTSGGPYTAIPGATDATYSAPTSSAGITYYRVVVTDPSSDCTSPASDEIELTVNEDAQITAFADNAEVCVGGAATIVANLTGGSSAATLQWEESITSGGPYTGIPGETNATFSAPTGSAGTTYYRVVVSDPNSDCATPASDEVFVVVNEDAEVSIAVDNAEVCVGGSALLTAVLTGGSSAATLQWDSSATSGGPYTAIVGATNLTYNASTAVAGAAYTGFQ